MFRTKICGITRIEDALVCRDAGADAIGLNFYSGSPRYVSPNHAAEIAAALDGGLMKIGVFVNATAPEILDTAAVADLDAVQLHGDEPPEFTTGLGDYPVIKAFRKCAADWSPLRDYVALATRLGRTPDAILVDAHEPGRYGGTGKTLDWPAVAELARSLPRTSLVLAGGLTPENVRSAILAAMPSSVDTASGVESAPGIKDASRVRAFVTEALAGFEQLDRR